MKPGSLAKRVQVLPPIQKLLGSLTNNIKRNCLPGNLVAKTLAGDDGDISSNTLVGVEVGTQTSVVLLNDQASGLLHGLGTNATPT